MNKYKLGTVLYGNDGYTYRVKEPGEHDAICSYCIFNKDGDCRMHNVLNIVSCTSQVEGVFEHVKFKGGI